MEIPPANNCPREFNNYQADKTFFDTHNSVKAQKSKYFWFMWLCWHSPIQPGLLSGLFRGVQMMEFL